MTARDYEWPATHVHWVRETTTIGALQRTTVRTIEEVVGYLCWCLEGRDHGPAT